jgi:hypothetical protein
MFRVTVGRSSWFWSVAHWDLVGSGARSMWERVQASCRRIAGQHKFTTEMPRLK